MVVVATEFIVQVEAAMAMTTTGVKYFKVPSKNKPECESIC